MRRIFLFLAVLIFSFLLGWYLNENIKELDSQNPIVKIVSKPLEKYSIESLAKAKVKPTSILIGETLKSEKSFTSYAFSLSFDPTLAGGPEKKVTGLINIPAGPGPFPAVVMFRGYVDQKNYTTGDGTRRSAEVFAKNGLLTVAPDFLGYDGSDSEAPGIFESRFQTYTAALTILGSLSSIEMWDKKSIFIWGHSNGGQIALTVLEITQGAYPTVLWAPVSKPFPYSILYYTDESDDRGRLIRKELAKFEELYDVENYSLVNYLGNIKAPIQLHQGTADDAVPAAWSDSLAKALKADDADIEYLKYPGANHNLTPGWNTAVTRNLIFFRSHMPD